jgi:hypothetical protein
MIRHGVELQMGQLSGRGPQPTVAPIVDGRVKVSAREEAAPKQIERLWASAVQEAPRPRTHPGRQGGCRTHPPSRHLALASGTPPRHRFVLVNWHLRPPSIERPAKAVAATTLAAHGDFVNPTSASCAHESCCNRASFGTICTRGSKLAMCSDLVGSTPISVSIAGTESTTGQTSVTWTVSNSSGLRCRHSTRYQARVMAEYSCSGRPVVP